MNTYELTPLTQKSFNKKAIVTILDDGTHELTSYDTVVATYHPEHRERRINGWYSQTTARHINAFLNHHNLPTMTKAEMEDEASI